MDLTFSIYHHAPEIPDMTKSKKKILLPLAHVIAWLVFLSLPAIFNPRQHGTGIFRIVNDIMEPPRWTNGLFLIALFYVNYSLVIPGFFFTRKYLLLALSFIVSFNIFFLLNYFMMPTEIKSMNSDAFTPLGNSFNLFMFIIVYSFSFAICLYEQWQRTRDQILNTEIQFLKAQINPHFLFNTLNSIYSLALIKSDHAPDAIVKLSGMMRYSISDANQSFVSLSKEINYITNYVELQKLRLTDKVKISFDLTGQVDGKQLVPFLLIPFVENAFKHGVNAEENSDIRIIIAIEDKDIQLSVVNNKVFMRKDIEKGEGLGVNTTCKRLELLYPGRHELKVTDNEKEFSIFLKIIF